MSAASAIATRRAWPIHAYIGPNGSGKSTAAVLDSMVSLEAGRPVLSTVRILDWRQPLDAPPVAHPLYQRLIDWRQVLDAERCDVLLDEVTGVASSRESAGLPPAVANLLVQLRRRDVVLRWTAPSWARADKIIRECTQAVTVAKSYWPERHQHDGREWRRRRLFRWSTYDADSFEEWTVSARERAQRLASQWFWAPGKDVHRAFDSLDAVDSITSVTDAGRCVDCGGVRRAPECSCEAYRDRRDAARADRRTGRPPGRRTAGPHRHDHDHEDSNVIPVVGGAL